MIQKYRNYIMWALFGLLILMTMMVQTTLFGRVRFFGVKLSLLPIAMVCIGMQVRHEAAGLFGMLAALLWYALGAEDGSMAIVTFTLTGVLSGWLCDNVFPRRFLPAVLLSLGALLFHEGGLYLIKYYLGSASGQLAKWVPLTAVLSLAVSPVLYLLAKLIGKAGGGK